MARPPKQRTPPPLLDLAPLKALLASARMLWAAAGVAPDWRRAELAEDALWTLKAIERASGIRGDHLGRHLLEQTAIDAAFGVLDAAEWLGSMLDQGDPAEVGASRDRLASELALLAPAIEVIEAVRGLSDQTQEVIRRGPGRPEPDPERNQAIREAFESGTTKSAAIVAKLKDRWPDLNTDKVNGVLGRKKRRSRRNASE